MTGILILDPDPKDWLQMQNWVWRILLQRAQRDADDEIRQTLHQGEIFQRLDLRELDPPQAKGVAEALLVAIDGTADEVRGSGHPSEKAHLEFLPAMKERLRRYSSFGTRTESTAPSAD